MRAQWMRGEAVCLSSLDEVPADQPDREVLRNIGVKSTATFPLIAGGRTSGRFETRSPKWGDYATNCATRTRTCAGR